MGSGSRWKVATVRGIPLYVSTSWLFIVAYVVWAQYAFVIRRYEGLVGEVEAVMLAVMVTVLFFGSVLIHECAHAAAARALDLPVMGITLVFWGGATETRTSGRGPGAEFLVAFVGPASTLVMAGIFWAVSGAIEGVASDLVGWLARISLIFAALNTVPGFPLDGGRVFLATVWAISGSRRTGMRAAGYVGTGVGVAMAALAAWSLTRADTVLAFFLGFLAFVLISTGRSMEQRIAFRDQLVRGTVADVMRPPPRAVPAELPLSETLDRYLRVADGGWFPVVEQGRVVGTVSFASASKVGRRDPLRPARDGMAPLMSTPTLAPEDTLDDALEWLGGKEGLVLRDGTLAGAIGPDDIERWYRRVVEGGADPPVGVEVPPRPDR